MWSYNPFSNIFSCPGTKSAKSLQVWANWQISPSWNCQNANYKNYQELPSISRPWKTGSSSSSSHNETFSFLDGNPWHLLPPIPAETTPCWKIPPLNDLALDFILNHKISYDTLPESIRDILDNPRTCFQCKKKFFGGIKVRVWLSAPYSCYLCSLACCNVTISGKRWLQIK